MLELREKLRKKATRAITENLSDKLFMDRSHLFRKLKALTGESPSNLIRTISVKIAAKFLENAPGVQAGFSLLMLKYYLRSTHTIFSKSRAISLPSLKAMGAHAWLLSLLKKDALPSSLYPSGEG